MKHRVKNSLREMARHVGLTVKFVSYFDDQTHGKLIARERRILINANKPRTEHIYTLLHELGHYWLHVLNRAERRTPWYLEIHWQNKFLSKMTRTVRRYLRFIFNKQDGLEWEADLWALCAFYYLAKHIGCKKDFTAFLRNHPEKRHMYWLISVVATWHNVKACYKFARQKMRELNASGT